MGILGSLFKSGGDTIKGTMEGAGALAKDIRTAITGEISPEKKAEIEQKLLEFEAAALQAQASVIMAEANGQSWLQRNWRPILMLSIVAIVVNNYLLFPYLALFGIKAVNLDLPKELFNLMTVGVGGYIVGRSGEKISENLGNRSS